MKSYRNKSISFNFSILSRNCIGFLLLFFSLNGTAQIHISENTLIHISENTTLFSTEGFTETTKKEIAKGIKHTQIINFSDSLIQVVKIKNKKPDKKIELTKVETKKEPKSLPKETTNLSKEEENKLFSLVYKSFPKSSSDFFSFYGSSRLAVVQNYSKTKEKKQTFLKENFHFTYNYVAKKKNNLSYHSDKSILSLYNLEKYITRPPPDKQLNSIS